MFDEITLCRVDIKSRLFFIAFGTLSENNNLSSNIRAFPFLL
ncbi:MAG: hypothetical protein ACI8PD_002533 [Nitrospinales bacterium]